MSGRVGNLSTKQSVALEQFKKNVDDVIKPRHDDEYLLRWLRARNFNLKKSEKMLRDSLAWRVQTGADTILDDWQCPDVLTNYYPGGLHGYDKEGNPIWIEPVGRSDIRGLLHAVKRSDILKRKISDCEKIHRTFKECSKKLDKPVEGLVILLDMEHYGLKHLWKPGMDVLFEVLTIFEANYPETLKCTYVVNAPRIFPMCFNLVKPFLSDDTRKKVFVFGANWKEKLLKYIDADQLPQHWGGTATDPDGDPYCRSKVCIGGEVPKELYIQKTNFVDLDTFTTVQVGRSSSLTVKMVVVEAGSLLRWQFLTVDNDIGFGVYRQLEDDKKMEAVIPPQIAYSHMVPEDGAVVVERPGVYVLKFDNTYSWVRSKKLHYLVEVLPPEGDSDGQTPATLPTSPSQTFILN